MKVLMLDIEGEGCLVDLGVRAVEAKHKVKYWLPPYIGGELRYGQGLVPQIEDWEAEMDWADLIVIAGNSRYHARLAEYFGRGYPIFGTNIRSGELELDRGVGQQVLADHGIEVAPYTVVNSPHEAIAHIAKTGKPFAIKPWGGASDKAMTYVPHEADDAIFTLDKWIKQGKTTGQLMLQEKVDGIEIGISGFFGPGGWLGALEESFEHKKFLTGDLGENTGEMGTVIRHVKRSKLFDALLQPLTDHLQSLNYVGDCAVNCIVDKRGDIFPLEFTMRLGWPDFTIRFEVIKSDPVEWMLDLLRGVDSLEVSPDVAVGVLIAHGDFPRGGMGDTRAKDLHDTWDGYPITGWNAKNWQHLHWQQVRDGEATRLVRGAVVQKGGILTAGNYPVVVSGSGGSVSKAKRNAYAVVEEIRWPSNLMYRLDIGDRLKDELPLLQKHGFATGMEW
jgi:phosphoribosylamine---glycine ligase